MGSVVPLDGHLRPPQSARGPRMVVALVALLLGVWTMILAPSGGLSPTTTGAVPRLQSGAITSFEDVAGTYLRRGVGEPMYFLFFEDGTVHISSNTDLVVDRPMGVFATSFDGTEVFITNTRLRFGCAPPDQGGTYEIHVMANGNLQFVAVGVDTCLGRSGKLLGRRFGITTAQFEPVS
jgi:hypothetical protein